MTDPSARAVLAALELCSALADARPDAPITIATLTKTHRAPRIPAAAGQGGVTLTVLSDAVYVTVARRGDTRTLWSVAVPFPHAAAGPSVPDASRVGSRAYRATLGADLEAALLVAREQTGAAA